LEKLGGFLQKLEQSSVKVEARFFKNQKNRKLGILKDVFRGYLINGWIDEEIIKPSSKDLIWSVKDRLLIDKSTNTYHTYNSTDQCKTKEVDMYI